MHLINKLAFITIIMTTLFAFDGMSIGYDGGRFQSATFHNGQLIAGLDFLHANVSNEVEKVSERESDNCQSYNNYGYCIQYYTELYTEIEDNSASINVFMPRIGYKIPGSSSGKIDVYNQIEAYLVYPMVSIAMDDAGSETNDVEEVIEDIIDVMGFKFSKIIQYNFNEQLALMAHVGFNLTIGDIDNDLVETAIGGRLGMTYTKLSLKFNL